MFLTFINVTHLTTSNCKSNSLYCTHSNAEFCRKNTQQQRTQMSGFLTKLEKRGNLHTVNARKLACYGHTMSKQGTMPGALKRGRPHTAWMDDIKTWTGLSVLESIRITANRDKWRKYVHGVANRRTEDGYRTGENRIVCIAPANLLKTSCKWSREKQTQLVMRWMTATSTYRLGMCRAGFKHVEALWAGSVRKRDEHPASTLLLSVVPLLHLV